MLLSIILFTGCTVVRIDTTNIDNIISIVLSKKNTLYNRVGKGYKYYVPRGVTYIDTTELNDKLYSNGNYYSLGKKIGKFGFSVQKNKKRRKK